MKKKLYFLAAGLLAATAVYAQMPQPMFKVCKSVTPPDESAEIVFEVPDGETSYFSRNSEFFSYEWGQVYKSDIKGSVVRQIYVQEDGNVWLSNPLSDFTLLSYVKAHFDSDGSLVIEGPQFVYDEYDDWEDELVKFYLVPMKLVTDEIGTTYVPADDMKYVLKKTENGYKAEDPDMMLGLARYGEIADNEGNPTGELSYAWTGFGERNISYESRQPNNGITPPADATVEKWAFKDPYENELINVAIDGSDLYIQGIDRKVPDAWVKASISGDKVTIPSGAYLGIEEQVAYFSYLWGAHLEYDTDEDGNEQLRGSATDNVVFSYDAANKSLVLDDGYAICSMPDDFYLLTLYEKVSIYKQNRDVNTPPAKPSYFAVTPMDEYLGFGLMDIVIPPVDTEGNVLDKDKLYYRIYIQNELWEFYPEEYPYLGLTEPMINIPYGLYDNDMIFISGTWHSILFDLELPKNECGVQTMYINEEGKPLYSEITSSDPTGVEDNIADRKVVSRSFYNIQGQAVSESYKGVKISKTVYDDGTVKVSKYFGRGH